MTCESTLHHHLRCAFALYCIICPRSCVDEPPPVSTHAMWYVFYRASSLFLINYVILDRPSLIRPSFRLSLADTRSQALPPSPTSPAPIHAASVAPRCLWQCRPCSGMCRPHLILQPVVRYFDDALNPPLHHRLPHRHLSVVVSSPKATLSLRCCPQRTTRSSKSPST